nr:DUF1488 family protein [Burkholderia cenocepacia]
MEPRHVLRRLRIPRQTTEVHERRIEETAVAYEPTPGTEPFEKDGDVHFSLTVDGIVQRFCVSREALDDHFGDPPGTASDRLAAFERGKERIYRAAAAKQGTPSSGVLVVGTFDF